MNHQQTKCNEKALTEEQTDCMMQAAKVIEEVGARQCSMEAGYHRLKAIFGSGSF
ncbi:hypothetical protein AB9P05_15670 [Roseivirga sp. BDSF3-8]|uniref:hypothetical protein n=1 Tax=Roseivirga sp. BDSF3-8 TaxID=3241598 RepID=UPI003531A921